MQNLSILTQLLLDNLIRQASAQEVIFNHMNIIMSVRRLLLLILVGGAATQLIPQTLYILIPFQNRCATTFSGCQCAIGDVCSNPYGQSKQPWCYIDESSCPHHSVEEVPQYSYDYYHYYYYWYIIERLNGYVNTEPASYCLPGCETVDDIISLQDQGDTIQGCQCKNVWEYYGDVYFGCANPDGDILGDWCVVDEESCPSSKLQFAALEDVGRCQRNLVHYDYCVNKINTAGENIKNVSSPALPSPDLDAVKYPTSPSTFPDIESPSASPSPAPTDVNSPNRTPRPTPTGSPPPVAPDRAQPVPTPVPNSLNVDEDCTSLMTELNSTDISTFGVIVAETGLGKEVGEFKDVTVFAPTNQAIQNFADDQRIDVADFFLFQANIAALKEIAMLHFADELLGIDTLQENIDRNITTKLPNQQIQLQGNNSEVLVVSPNGDFAIVLDAPVVEVCEGLIYRIDTVLTPSIGA
eukprot:TRINITY_DN625_c0_g4_i5.p1 TRINITY_DN625_c0_g4~~TRINITY_DN625_c0_g4_i5.p1  ORF type:complete len:468 (-),score=43.92 TRINITY_DN625_c0_g4_i5:229-1632(-)